MEEKLISLPQGYDLAAYDEIDSTNEEGRRRGDVALAAGNSVNSTWIIAERQSAGRGRQGRKWEDATGNLLCTLLIDPACGPAKASELSFVTGLAVADAVDDLLGDPAAELKWPNDVLLEGAKVSGILLESAAGSDGALGWLAIGIGLNLKWFPGDTPYPATSLKAHGANIALEQGLTAVAAAMEARLQMWRREGFAAIRQAWLGRAKNLGGQITARLPGETVEGQFAGMDENGALLLKLGATGEIRAITAGDVFFGAMKDEDV
ncbi:MAG: biotin--[acetyl-CoA-carboxylase] ligase [Alphaproteobacteria bacterium]